MKAIVSDLTEIPEALRSEYEERDGKYVLKVDGELPGYVRDNDYRDMRTKVSKFRDGYTSLMKRVKELTGADEVDEELTPLRTLIADLKEKAQQAKGDGEGEMEARIQRAIRPLQEKLDAAERREAEATARANRSTLRESIGSELQKVGAKPTALDILLDLAERSFEVKDDQIVAKEGLLTDRGDPITTKDWISQTVKERDFLFEASTGGGTGGGTGNGAPKYPPGTKILRNPTPQQLGEHMDDIAAGKMQIVND